MKPLLYHEELGTRGASLVFLPGVGATTRYFERRVAPLADTHRLVLVDNLGFGRSPKPWVRYSIDRHVDELERVLSGEQRLTFVGHSFGAILALAYAARHPITISRLILLSLPHFGGVANALRYFRQRRGPDRWLMTNVVLAALTCVLTRRILGRLLPRLLRDLPPEVAKDLIQHTWLSSTSTIWNGVYAHDAAADADRLNPDLPVLCLHGDRDTTAPLANVERLASGRRSWELQVLPGADHHPLLRYPDACIAAIRSFIEHDGHPEDLGPPEAISARAHRR